MTNHSNWSRATDELCCPFCGAMNKPTAAPTLEREQDGSYTCAQCATNFRAPKDDVRSDTDG